MNMRNKQKVVKTLVILGHFAIRGFKVTEPKNVPKGIVKEISVVTKPNLSIVKGYSVHK